MKHKGVWIWSSEYVQPVERVFEIRCFSTELGECWTSLSVKRTTWRQRSGLLSSDQPDREVDADIGFDDNVIDDHVINHFNKDVKLANTNTRLHR